MKKSKVAKRSDVPDPFWKKFDMHDLKTKKVMGLYEAESLDNPNVCTTAINPKEYFEKFKNSSINKKHKGVRCDTPGMNFESYANRITPLRSLDCQKDEKKKIIQKRLQVKNTNMIMTSVNKVKFASLNDKRYYFSDGIVPLPYGHPLLKEVREYKKSLPDAIHVCIEKEKDKLLQLENKVVRGNERLRILRSIFSQPITYYNMNSTARSAVRNEYTPARNHSLNYKWL